MAKPYHLINAHTGETILQTDDYGLAEQTMIEVNLANKKAGNPEFLELINLNLRWNMSLAQQVGYDPDGRIRDGIIRRY